MTNKEINATETLNNELNVKLNLKQLRMHWKLSVFSILINFASKYCLNPAVLWYWKLFNFYINIYFYCSRSQSRSLKRPPGVLQSEAYATYAQRQTLPKVQDSFHGNAAQSSGKNVLRTALPGYDEPREARAEPGTKWDPDQNLVPKSTNET